MRKSQVISLIILLVLVTVTIWVGAFYNGKDNGGDELLPTATDTTAPLEVTPAPTESITITDEEIAQLSTEAITWAPSFVDGALKINVDNSDILAQMQEYGCIYDGSSYNGEGAYFTIDTSYYDSQAEKDITAALDALQNTGAKATFFLSKEFITEAGAAPLVKRMVEEGHQIGNRGSIEGSMSALSADEFKRALEAVENGFKSIMGNNDAEIKFYRPFGGIFSIRDLALARQKGYTTVLWTSLYASQPLNSLESRINTELQKNSIFSLMAYSIQGDRETLEKGIQAAAAKYNLMLLGS